MKDFLYKELPCRVNTFRGWNVTVKPAFLVFSHLRQDIHGWEEAHDDTISTENK